MNEFTAVKALAALAQVNRLQVFRLMIVAGPEGLTPGHIGEVLEIPGATLSFHLKELCHAGLIVQERQGRNLIYRPDIKVMNSLLTYLTENCCQGKKCLDEAMISCNTLGGN